MSILPGIPAPLFSAPSPVNPNFAFGSLGGQYVLLVFLPPPSPEREAALGEILARTGRLRDDQLLAFAVLPDESSFAAASQTQDCLRWFFDPDGELRRLYGAADQAGGVRPLVVAIDPMLRVLGCAPLDRVGEVADHVAGLGAPADHAGAELHAPVLMVPRIIDPMKSRHDGNIPPGPLLEGLRTAVAQRLAPEIAKAFQFNATRIERFIVACYDAGEGGWFRPHRDNTTPGTAHRKFAVSINLNGDFDGGDLRFPEFGPRTYRPPAGGAVVFSCSLLHEATPVTRGRRYATLPFLYDDAGARVREANLHTFAS